MSANTTRIRTAPIVEHAQIIVVDDEPLSTCHKKYILMLITCYILQGARRCIFVFVCHNLNNRRKHYRMQLV